ncbi:hypothetical protein [Sphingobacterium tabacisoli]|uniref:DoxX family protein n=1 Tax=Sphingobacterium tabacisoli TaxID=2044855 RepID=A0ABW5L3A1_9SPHI|nr:hypothetical protein [Sphingobacterium tabacisoli]
MKMINKMQGYYYFLSGIWPLIHLESFINITGYKNDIWLVNMVGLLALSIGITLLIRPFHLLGLLVALSFLAIDVIYVQNGTIATIYLVDASVQLVFIAGFVFLYYKRILSHLRRHNSIPLD